MNEIQINALAYRIHQEIRHVSTKIITKVINSFSPEESESVYQALEIAYKNSITDLVASVICARNQQVSDAYLHNLISSKTKTEIHNALNQIYPLVEQKYLESLQPVMKRNSFMNN